MSARKQGLGILGFGAAACVACCAGPILAFLGGVGIVGLASTVVIGSAGLAIATVAGVAWVVVRHRRTAAACSADGPGVPTAVASPTRRAPS